MICPSCKKEITQPPAFWQDRVAPWSCSYCGELYGISNNGRAFPIPEGFRPLAPLLPEKIANRFCYYSHPCNYVYALCYSTGIPFYVGVGRGDRAMQHAAETKRLAKENALFTEKNIEISRLLSSGHGVWYHFLALTDDREQALSAESFWINYWEVRAKGGLLTNRVYPESEPELPDLQPPDPPDKDVLDQPKILVFQHPDIVVCPPSLEDCEGQTYPYDTIECCACGSNGVVTKGMHGQHLVCSNCGHYVFGMDFRERFPHKKFAHGELIWEVRRKNPSDW